MDDNIYIYIYKKRKIVWKIKLTCSNRDISSSEMKQKLLETKSGRETLPFFIIIRYSELVKFWIFLNELFHSLLFMSYVIS